MSSEQRPEGSAGRQPSPRRAWAWSRRIDFVRDKYGAELLIDLCWVHDLSTFILTDEPHWLGFYEILLITRGRGTIWIDARPARVAPGHVLFTSPGQIRRWRAAGVDGLCLFFTSGFVTEFFSDPLFLHRLPFFHDAHLEPVLAAGPAEERRLRARLSAMKREIGSRRRDAPHVLRAMLYELLMRLSRAYRRRYDVEPGGPVVDTVFRFRQLVEARLTRTHRVADYARLLGLTPGHLNDLTRRHLGQSAGGVIRSSLLVEARRRLAYSEQTVSQIAVELGFEDPSYFTRFFRRGNGRTPGAYRAAIREKHQKIRVRAIGRPPRRALR